MVKHIHLRSLVSGICVGQEVFWGSHQEERLYLSSSQSVLSVVFRILMLLFPPANLTWKHKVFKSFLFYIPVTRF